jgi:NitT/TauT family transport system substrate-binding protein
MTHIRKTLGTLAAAAALALTFTACSSGGNSDTPTSGAPTSDQTSEEPSAAPEPIEKVNFGYIGDFNGTSLLAIADDQGLWAKYGLEATTSVFTNGPLQIQAIGTGDLDFGYIGPGAFWLPASGQANIIMINTLGKADRVIAQPGINSIEELRGKTVAIPEGTSGDMILTLALERAGMTKADLNIVTMDAATIVSAFSSKAVDGAGFWYPGIATIKQQVPDLVELAKNVDFSDVMAFPTAFVAGKDVDEGKTLKVLRVLRDAVAFREANLDKTIELTAAMLQVTPEQVRSDSENVDLISLDDLDAWSQDGTITGWMTAMNDFFVAGGKLTDPLDPAEYYTGDLFVEAGK